jgi:ribosomal protein S18 acetylase RimI-like enzyme
MITIRLLTVEDVEEYHRLRLEALQDSPASFNSSYEDEVQMPLTHFTAKLQDNYVFGAYSDGDRLIGTAGLTREGRIKRAHLATLVGMHVSPAFRRQGIGGALLDRALRCAREWGGIKAVRLSVTVTNHDARKLYAARGFKSYGIEPGALHLHGEYLDEEYLTLQLDD